MKKILIITCFAMFAVLSMSADVCSSDVKSLNEHLLIAEAYDPSGTWNLEIETPEQTVDIIMIISTNDKGEFEISMEDTSDNETVELEEISFDEEEMIMTAEVDADGTLLEIMFEFDDDSVEGNVSAEGMEMTLSGERETD